MIIITKNQFGYAFGATFNFNSAFLNKDVAEIYFSGIILNAGRYQIMLVLSHRGLL